MSLVYDDLETMYRARGVSWKNGRWWEDSYDYGVWWSDDRGGRYRLTWIGPVNRDRPEFAGELYLLRQLGGGLRHLTTSAAVLSAGEPIGAVEVLCRIPPLEISTRADGWPLCPVCGEDELGHMGGGEADIDGLLFCHRCGRNTVAQRRPLFDADFAVEQVLEGWAEVCGCPGSVAWVRERVEAAIAAGRAEPVGG